MKLKLIRWFWCLTSIVLAEILSAQTPSEEFSVLKEKYPDQNEVTTDRWRKLNIIVKGDSLEIIQEEYEEVLILNNPLQNSKGRVYSSSLTEVFDIKAYTLIPGKKKYKKIDVKDFKKSFDRDSYVFYDDTEWINFNFPQITEGAKVVKHFKRRIKDPHIIGQYFFRPTSQLLNQIL
ncbi:MAG: hypothetical protein RIM99_19665 [Cyclobacteriaceae bacterium]